MKLQVQRLCVLAAMFAAAFTPMPSCGATGIEAYEPEWKSVELPSNVTYNIDVKSIRKDDVAGIISFHYLKKYRLEDVHDGEIYSIEGRLDYDSAKQEYTYRSMNFERKNKPAFADALVFAVPEWQKIEVRSTEEAMCQKAEVYLKSKTAKEGGKTLEFTTSHSE